MTLLYLSLKIQSIYLLLNILRWNLGIKSMLKELFLTNDKLKDNKEISVWKNVFNILLRILPPRCKNVNNGLLARKFDITHFKILMMVDEKKWEHRVDDIKPSSLWEAIHHIYFIFLFYLFLYYIYMYLHWEQCKYSYSKRVLTYHYLYFLFFYTLLEFACFKIHILGLVCSI